MVVIVQFALCIQILRIKVASVVVIEFSANLVSPTFPEMVIILSLRKGVPVPQPLR